MSHSHESSSSFASGDQFEKNNRQNSTENKMSQTALEQWQDINKQLHDFGSGYIEGASGTIKETVKVICNPGEAVQSVSRSISSDAHYLTDLPPLTRRKNLANSNQVEH